MVCSSRKITSRLSNTLKLIMTDVDDTITAPDGTFSASLKETLKLIQQHGIMVGLISGRNMNNLRDCAQELKIKGPLVAENGGQIRLRTGSRTVNFGNHLIVKAELSRLKNKLEAAITDGEWNRERLTDRILGYRVESLPEIVECLEKTDIIETGYTYAENPVLHLVERGISKGATLTSLLKWMEDGDIRPETTLVVGDGPNDLSMFNLFPHSVLIPHERQPIKYHDQLHQAARYLSHSSGGEGFVEVARHILDQRS